MRIILGSDFNTARQLIAAHKAIEAGIEEGQFWGFLIEGEALGVKRNKDSVRVYPPTPTQQGEGK